MVNHSLQETTDYKAFDSVVTPQDIADYRASKKQNLGSAWIVAIVILSFMSSIFFIGFVVKVLIGLSDGHMGPAKTQEAIDIGIAALALAVPIFPLYFLNKSATNRTIASIIRFRRFVTDNHWQFNQKLAIPHSEGMLFNEGDERRTTDVVRSFNGTPFTIGTHNYVTGIGRGRSMNEWGYITVPIEKALPHIVLDAIANNGKIFSAELFTNLPHAFSKDKQISVSPAVDAIYHVYSADGMSDSIGSVITPEFAAKMKQLAKLYDIEIVDGMVYLYRFYGFKKTKKAMQEVMAIIDTIVETFGVTALDKTTNSPAAKATTDAVVTAAPTLKGATPQFVKVLGIAAVIIQFIALIGLVITTRQ
jgi:hypothetical protein